MSFTRIKTIQDEVKTRFLSILEVQDKNEKYLLWYLHQTPCISPKCFIPIWALHNSQASGMSCVTSLYAMTPYHSHIIPKKSVINYKSIQHCSRRDFKTKYPVPMTSFPQIPGTHPCNWNLSLTKGCTNIVLHYFTQCNMTVQSQKTFIEQVGLRGKWFSNTHGRCNAQRTHMIITDLA